MGYVGANVRARRRELGMTQDELAEAIGIEPRHLRYIEHGEAGASYDTLASLAEALELEAGELLSRRKQPDIPRGRPPSDVDE